MHAVSPGLTGTFVVGQWVPGSPPRFASRIGFNALLAVGQRSNTVLDAPLDIPENARVSQVATTALRGGGAPFFGEMGQGGCMFRFHVLGLLRSREALHGYALMKEYNRRTGRTYGAGYFYRQIGQLIRQGYVRPARKEFGTDRRRAPYEITEKGADAFDEWLEAVPRRPLECDVLRVGRAIFLSEAQPLAAAKILATWQRDLVEQARSLERDLAEARKRARGDLVDVRPILIERDLRRVACDLGFLDAVGEMIGGVAG